MKKIIIVVIALLAVFNLISAYSSKNAEEDSDIPAIERILSEGAY